jgi:hypothetical protein
VLNDALKESSETVQVRVTATSERSTLSSALTELIIVDDDTGSPVVKYPENRSFFGFVINGGNTVADTVYTLYDGLLNRTPEGFGFEFWLDQLVGKGKPLSEVVQGLLLSKEFQDRFGDVTAGTNQSFVEKMYAIGLSRAPEEAGLANWTSKLESGVSRLEVARDIALSEENKVQLRTAAPDGAFVPDVEVSIIARVYHTLLDRAPDKDGLRFWQTAFESSQSFTDVARGFIGSDEFQATRGGLGSREIIDLMYQGALSRSGSAAEIDEWLAESADVRTDFDALFGISQSQEAKLNLVKFIEDGWYLA